MGSCMSTVGVGGSPYLASNHVDGGEDEYRAQYVEGRVLGQGEFGAVKLCHDATAGKGSEELAVKILKKGMTFKDNTVYGALKPEVLQAECDILRTLAGKQYCLKLVGCYETPKVIYVVTELCSGGEMMEYVSQQNELRTEDVSRISFQLLSAINHCAKNGIIHRDLKAENVMFEASNKNAELRLIDFGCGTRDKHQTGTNDDLTQHTTFAGSAFYISPEMFQHTYTSATDVWSAGVTLYVLVAGYPADDLQKAFNILQKSKNRDLRKLPNLPSNLPDSYYEMLEQLLTYRHKSRPTAGSMTQHEFVQFSKLHANQSTDASSAKRMKMSRTASVHFKGSVERHGLVLDYQKFERAVTTLLATMLNRDDYEQLLATLERKDKVHTTKLKIVPMGELKNVLNKMNQSEIVNMIDNLPNASGYDTFAYHIVLLKQFSRAKDSANEGRAKRSMSMSISAGMLNKSDGLQTNALATNAPAVSKLNGTVETHKPMRSQSVAVLGSKPARAQSVMVGRTTNLADDLKSFKPLTTLESVTEVDTLAEVKRFNSQTNVSTMKYEKTATISESLDEGEFDC